DRPVWTRAQQSADLDHRPLQFPLRLLYAGGVDLPAALAHSDLRGDRTPGATDDAAGGGPDPPDRGRADCAPRSPDSRRGAAGAPGASRPQPDHEWGAPGTNGPA